MIAEAKLATLHNLVEKSSEEELLWMSGYLAGLVARNPPKQILLNDGNQQPAPPFKPAITDTITIVYGTETGNAKKAATQAASCLKKLGNKVKLVAAEQYKTTQLEDEKFLLIVISTQGEGEPPAAAKPLYDYLLTQNPDVRQLKYSVLALGSKAYPLYCAAGIEIDNRLKTLGAINIIPVQTCDEAYEAEAALWMQELEHYFKGQPHTQPNASNTLPAAVLPSKEKQIYSGTITTNITLNDTGSIRHCNHIEIKTETPFTYETGDAVGIVPENDDVLIGKILTLTGLDGNTLIDWKKEQETVFNILKYKANVLHLSTKKVKAYATLIAQEIPEMRMDFYDLLRIYPLKDGAQAIEAIQLLDGMSPRIYTLSSASEAHGMHEIHLTVLRTTYEKEQEKGYGHCSTFLCTLPVGTGIRFFLHRQKHFRLPAPEKPVIMFGPGTGIAPFRAFLFSRDFMGATGKNWLFFGEHDFTRDFYYQTEIQSWFETGTLHQINLSFEKGTLHVQPIEIQILTHAAEIWQWIQDGCSLFVSGDKEPMSILVENALLQVMEQQGNMTDAAAKSYLKQLASEGRYAKDVY